MSEVPAKPRAVRVMQCLTTSVQLTVDLPEQTQSPRITGFVIQNELQVIHADLGTVWRILQHYNYHFSACLSYT